jgi:peptidoglycan/xylan/chitin deacetylase (PgdA/CDA1 family)
MDDVAMKDYSSEAHYEKVLDFCAEQDIRGTFFVVPRSGGLELTEKADYIRLLQRAMREGHEVGQHGLDHDRFEAGIPPQMILDLPHEGPTREYLANHRDELTERHTVEALRGMLKSGRDIISNAIGFAPVGFRGPSGATCANLSRAEALNGYRYDSTRMLQKAAWDLLNGVYEKPCPINREIFDSMQPEEDIAEIPGAGEYTWYLDEKNYAVTLELAKHDFHQCLESGIPFVSVSHVSPMQQTEASDDAEIGFEFYREILTYCRQYARQNNINFVSVTLNEICDRLAGN